MRRPHVYERSAPRSSRSAYHEPAGQAAAAAKDIATALAGLLAKAEACGFLPLAGSIQHAMREAELQIDRGRLQAAPAPTMDEVTDDGSGADDIEGLLRILDK